MPALEKSAAQDLARAFLRKNAQRTRFLPAAQQSEEKEKCWIFDFYHPRWRSLRGKEPYGVRISVHKQTGKARHFATLVAGKPGPA
jgi:hypothetical protein